MKPLLRIGVRIGARISLAALTLAGMAGAACAAEAQPPAQNEAQKVPGWVLSATALGPLKLYKGATVSQAKLQKLFPGYRVSYEIEQGATPAFHYFEVASPEGQPLFGISSFITGHAKARKTPAAVPIDLVRVYSPLIPDAYGLRVGDHVEDILARRGQHLEFGAAHHDVYLGGESLYYGLITGRKTSPAVYKVDDAIRGNWEIRFVSWPEPAWE